MTGQDFRDRLMAIVTDLQFSGKGKTVEIMLRNENNQASIYPLSSDVNGVVNAVQFAAIDAKVADLEVLADDYVTNTAPYTAKAAELKAIAVSPAYLEARGTYQQYNLTENFAELQDAKGSYVI